MVARLGFAIATDVQPDILILDEVLSVGDESFKSKCRQRIQNFWRSNTTVLLVSHDLEFVQQECDQAIWLDRGKVKLQGDAKTVVRQYLYSINQNIDLPASDWNVGVQEALYQGMMNGSVL
jgi:ABC-type polysaccharide/polyol phosphate transport system ATPase subunit